MQFDINAHPPNHYILNWLDLNRFFYYVTLFSSVFIEKAVIKKAHKA